MPTVYKRAGSPYYQFRHKTSKGYQRRSTGKRNRAEAQEYADNYEETNRPVGGDKLSVAHSEFIVKHKLKPKSVASYESSYRMFLATLGDFYLKALKVADIETYIKTRLTKCGSPRVKRDLSYLSSLYNWAMTQADGPEVNPLDLLNRRRFRLRESKPRSNWLTEAQFGHLLSLCDNPTHRAILIVAVETGMRRDEILQLRREEVELKARRIVIGNLGSDRTKTSESRIVPLTDLAHDTLRDTLERHTSVHVFVNPITEKARRSIHGWWYALCRKGGFAGLRFHDLRHTFASWCAQRGVDERTVQAWLGHKTRSMTHRYQHLREADLKAAVDKFNRSTK